MIFNSLEHSSSWEANSSSAGQEIPRILWNPKFTMHSQAPATCPYSQPDKSSPWPPTHLMKMHFNIIFPSRPGSSQWSLSLMFRHQNPVLKLSCPPYMPHALPISFFLIWSPEYCLMTITGRKASRYVVFFTLCYVFLLRPKYSPQHPIIEHP